MNIMFIETYIALVVLALLVPVAIVVQAQHAYNIRRNEIRREQRSDLSA